LVLFCDAFVAGLTQGQAPIIAPDKGRHRVHQAVDRGSDKGNQIAMNAEPDRMSLDPGALDRLRELDPDGRHGVLRRVLQAFETSLARMLAQLQSELGQGRAETVAGVAHTLKSSAASVGALSLSRLCAEVERQRHGGQGDGLDDDIRRLIAEGGLALQAVRAMLHD